MQLKKELWRSSKIKDILLTNEETEVQKDEVTYA